MSFARREFLAGGMAALAARRAAAAAPADPVALARCPDYGAELVPTLARMFDQLGGLGRLVKGKTVAVKVNLTGAAETRLGHAPAGAAHWTHPAVIGATVHLLGKAGARRIRLLESPWNTIDPIEEFIVGAGWEPRDLLTAAKGVEFENTNYLGRGRRYARLPVASPYTYPAFDLNHSYTDCDVFVSLAKMKEHAIAGVTLSMKNCFGIAPCTIYGDQCAVDEPQPGARRRPQQHVPFRLAATL